MSWTAYEFDSKKKIGVYPTEMDMAAALRAAYEPGRRFVVENDDGREFEAFMDTATVRVVTDPPVAEAENDDVYADPLYRPSDQGEN